jgi:hypothetical protein
MRVRSCFRHFPHAGDAASRGFTIFIEQLPIPKIPESAQQPFITLVDQILTAKQNPPSPPFAKGGDDECSPLCKRGDRGDFMDTSALECQIDKMVYNLYGLTENEIAIVEGK